MPTRSLTQKTDGLPRGQTYPRLLWPIAVTAILLTAVVNYDALLAAFGDRLPPIADMEAGRLALAAMGCLAFAWLASRAMELILTRMMVRKGRKPSRLLYQTIAVLMFVGAVVVILSFVFDRSLVGVLTTSGVLVAVIGFALRNVIADIFSGLALSFEGPYHIGDWIETEAGIRGRVVEINWRSTRLETRNQIHMVLPNSAIAAGRITNYSVPRRHYRVQLSIVLGFATSVEQAKRVLLAGALSAARIRRSPPPDVRVDGHAERGIRYVVRYWLPGFADEVDCRDAVLSSIDRHLRIAGIAAPYGHQRVVLQRERRPDADPMAEGAETIRRIPAFQGLTPHEVEQLARTTTRRFIPAGGPVEMPGDDAHALLVVGEGLVAVQDSEGRELGMLGAGDVLCRGPLLETAGGGPPLGVAAGSGAVLLDIPMTSLRPILARSPMLAKELKRAVERWRDVPAERMEAGQPNRRSADGGQPLMLQRIRALLRPT